jgi:hypothetical protein
VKKCICNLPREEKTKVEKCIPLDLEFAGVGSQGDKADGCKEEQTNGCFLLRSQPGGQPGCECDAETNKKLVPELQGRSPTGKFNRLPS